MSRLLRYLIPFVVVLALGLAADKSDSANADYASHLLLVEDCPSLTLLNSPESIPAVPRQISNSHSLLRSNARRTAPSQSRSHVELARPGKSGHSVIPITLRNCSWISDMFYREHILELEFICKFNI